MSIFLNLTQTTEDDTKSLKEALTGEAPMVQSSWVPGPCKPAQDVGVILRNESK